MNRPHAIGLWLVVLFAVAVCSYCSGGCGPSLAQTHARIAESTRAALQADSQALYGAITNEAIDSFQRSCDMSRPPEERLACSRGVVEQIAAKYARWEQIHNAAVDAYEAYLDAIVAAAESQDESAWQRVQSLADALAGHMSAIVDAARAAGVHHE
jgi:hypothetical protein